MPGAKGLMLGTKHFEHLRNGVWGAERYVRLQGRPFQVTGYLAADVHKVRGAVCTKYLYSLITDLCIGQSCPFFATTNLLHLPIFLDLSRAVSM